MVRVVERDNGLAARELARDLDRVLHGLRARVEQRGLLGVVARGEAVERLRHGHVALVRRDHEARVREGGGLSLHGLDHLGVGVANARHGDARAKVDERVAVRVDDDAAASGDGRDRHGVRNAGGDGGGLALKQGARSRPRNLGDEGANLGQRRAADERRVMVSSVVTRRPPRRPPRAPRRARRGRARSSSSVMISGGHTCMRLKCDERPHAALSSRRRRRPPWARCRRRSR